MLSNNEANLFGTSILMHNRKFDLSGFIIFKLEQWIQNETKLEILVDWSNSHIKTNPILLSNLDKMFQIFRYFDSHLRQITSYNHFVIKTKLFSGLTEPSHHLKNQEINSIILYYLLFLLFFKINRIWYTSSSFNNLIYYIITNCTILKTNYVNYWIWFNCIFEC